MDVRVLAVVVIGCCILFAVAGVAVTRRFLHGRVREGHNDVLVPMFLTAGTIYAVLLGFLVVAVWEAYDNAHANVGEEASTLATMYRQTNGMPDDERDAMRDHLREYAEKVASSEWIIQAKTGGADKDARRAVADIYREFAQMQPQQANSSINQAFLANMSIVAADRNKRTLQSGEQLPTVLWVGLLMGAVVVIGMTFLLYMEMTAPHVVMAGVMAGLIGTLLFVAMAFDRPFSGPLALSPEPFEHSLSVFKAVDAGG